MAQARNIGLSFDWEHADFDAPACRTRRRWPPRRARSAAATCSTARPRTPSDLVALEQLAERFGVPTYEGKLGDIFTLPDTIQRAVTAGS